VIIITTHIIIFREVKIFFYVNLTVKYHLMIPKEQESLQLS